MWPAHPAADDLALTPAGRIAQAHACGFRGRGGLAFMPDAWHMMGSWASEKILLPSSSGGVAA